MKQWWQRLRNWEYLGLLLLVLMTLVLHLTIIRQPGELVFDEQHYVKDARLILSGQGSERVEHPPLGKLMIAGSILAFGDNPVGWRILPIILGAIGVVLFYFICVRLGMNREATLLATFVFSLENLSFVQASIAMLDIFMLVFMLGSFLLYLNGNHLTAGMSAALSALAKLYGALGVPAMLLHWLLTRKTKIETALLVGASSALFFLFFMPLFNFVIWRQWREPIGEIKNMMSLMGSLTFANAPRSDLTRPWEWVLQPSVMFYWYDPHYIGALSFTVWALIFPALGYMVYRAIKRDNASLFALSWFAATYLVWIPASIITDRMSFIFYFYPTVGAICIGIGLILSRLMDIWRNRRSTRLGRMAFSGVAIYLVGHVAVFIILSPVFSKWVGLFHVV